MTTTSVTDRTARLSKRDHFADRYGPWAVVTGASAGVGEALARSLAARGLNVVLVARSRQTIEQLAIELETAHPVKAFALTLDLTQRDSIGQLIATTADLDVGLLVAAAGFGTSGPFLANQIDNEIEMIDVNCAAVCAQTHHFATRFAERGRGGVILLSPIVGFQGMPLAANYAATKAYIQCLGEGLTRELGRAGVDVLTAAPGPTASGFADRAGMRMSGADSPDQIADPILDALGTRATVLPSARSKFLRWAVITIPRRSGRVWIMGNVMKGMTKHRTDAGAVAS
jgi:short-subunit dehydrogenase